MINIGVGPSNAKTITDHVAVLRPHVPADARPLRRPAQHAGARRPMCWHMPMCARITCWTTTCRSWVPIPPLAEIQVALQEAVAEITGLDGYDLKRIMRTGTVATIDNRNWELRDQRGPVRGACRKPRHR